MAYDVTYNADFNILATITAPLFKSTDVRYNLGADFDGNGKLDFYDWYGELSKTNNVPTLKQLMFIEDIEDETGETFRGFTKEAATKFISDYVDNRESYDDYMGDCLNY